MNHARQIKRYEAAALAIGFRITGSRIGKHIKLWCERRRWAEGIRHSVRFAF